LPEPPRTELSGTALALTLPIAIPPKQIPELASIGIALSPYTIGAGYASTVPRQHALWIELKGLSKTRPATRCSPAFSGTAPIRFSMTQISSSEQPPEPPLVLDPELMTVVTPHDSDNCDGSAAMTQLEPASDSNRHFLLPPPDTLDPDDPDLFGFWTYELRVGHACHPHAPGQEWWSKAQARFGRPLRVSGVQHPAPTLYCRAGRVTVPLALARQEAPPVSSELLTAMRGVLGAAPAGEIHADLGLVTAVNPPISVESFIEVTAPTRLQCSTGGRWSRRSTGPKRPVLPALRKRLFRWMARSLNVLLNLAYDTYTPPRQSRFLLDTQRDRTGCTVFSTFEVAQRLFLLGLPLNSALSVLAVELLPGGTAPTGGGRAGPVARRSGAGRPPAAHSADVAACAGSQDMLKLLAAIRIDAGEQRGQFYARRGPDPEH
jgi:hypothetical protein